MAEKRKNLFIREYVKQNFKGDSYEAYAEKEDIANACNAAIEWAFDMFCEYMQSCEGYVVSGEKCNYDNFMKFMEE